ncbi:A24 family peptidase [uncultured Porticoccus sp.]|uniref:prepilin peptidase n=1 Tax=uncultured Porticoccus sp. TaxID=1256050 RepID=UPI0026249DE9|nr:A24 family peptidase [uncultured Porticoccus sp.]
MPDMLGLSVAPVLAVSLVLGLLVGSFINVVIYRLPRQLAASWRRDSQEFLEIEPDSEAVPEPLNVVFPASHCPQCGAPIKAIHNIPLLSYLLLRGRCAHCRSAISLQYPLVELVSGLLTLVVVYQFGLTATTALALLFSWSLLALTGIDFNEQLLPDGITLPLLWLGLLVNVNGLFTSLDSAVIGAAAGYLSLWSVFWLFKLVTGKEGMGHGDFKLLAALGAWLGWQQLLLIVLLSSLVGAVVGLLMIILLGRDRQIPIPFGPYLAAAGWIALLWGETLTSSYLTLF